jgi:hypothetical protein
MVKNKVVRISLMGGILGLILTNPRRALDTCVKHHNVEGWKCIFILNHSQNNILVLLLQIATLIATCGLWSWGGGYLVTFEKGG